MKHQKRRVPLLYSFYRNYLQSQDSAGFIRKVSEHYTVGTLERLTLHRRREVRRAAVLAIGFLADFSSNHVMGRALLDDDRTVRMLAENGIRSLWARAGSEEERQTLGIITRLNAAQHYPEAIRRAEALIEQAPWFAEAWNQRAVAHFHRGRFAEAIRDCHEALEINPYHFPAAAMMGQAYLELGNQVSALESLRRALRLNPDLESVRAHVVRLARMVEDRP
ncbi:MAG: tetratricopeptide repeat protein [Planctomycetota bacterium]